MQSMLAVAGMHESDAVAAAQSPCLGCTRHSILGNGLWLQKFAQSLQLFSKVPKIQIGTQSNQNLATGHIEKPVAESSKNSLAALASSGKGLYGHMPEGSTSITISFAVAFIPSPRCLSSGNCRDFMPRSAIGLKELGK